MGKEYVAKVFKSGNSLALRLPKALGLAEGVEMRVREEAGRYSFEPVAKADGIDVDSFWGKCPGLTVPAREAFEDASRSWNPADPLP